MQPSFDVETPKKRHHRASKKSGMKRVEKEVMLEYKREVDRIRKQKKCKIPTLKQFLDKRFKTRKHHRKSKAPVSTEEPEPEVKEESEVTEPQESQESQEPPEQVQEKEPSIANTLSVLNPFSSKEENKGGKKSRRNRK